MRDAKGGKEESSGVFRRMVQELASGEWLRRRVQQLVWRRGKRSRIRSQGSCVQVRVQEQGSGRFRRMVQEDVSEGFWRMVHEDGSGGQ